MMTTNNPDNHGSTPEDLLATQADAQLRELFSSLPVSRSQADFNHRVLAKVHRRKITMRATWAVSLIVLLATGWHLSTGGRDSQQPPRVAKVQPAGDAVPLPIELIDEVELFASAYQGLSSPVVQLETLENESQALLSYLSSLEETMEKK